MLSSLKKKNIIIIEKPLKFTNKSLLLRYHRVRNRTRSLGLDSLPFLAVFALFIGVPISMQMKSLPSPVYRRTKEQKDKRK